MNHPTSIRTSSEHDLPQDLDVRAVHRLLGEGRARLVDVREADEHRQQRIAGAASVPSSTILPGQVPAEIPGSNGIATVVHCRSGRRSADAARALRAAGCQVINMSGGIEAWKAAGLPVVEDRAAPMTVMQQTQLVMGALVLASTIAGAFWSPWALVLAGFIGSGMMFAGLTGSCAMADLLAKAPWNRGSSCATCSTTGK